MKKYISVKTGRGVAVHLSELKENGLYSNPICGTGACRIGTRMRYVPRSLRDTPATCKTCLKLAEKE